MSDTATNRKKAWGLQADYLTKKAIAAGAYKQILSTDTNAVDVNVDVEDNEAFSHGVNSATDQWNKSVGTAVALEIPGYSQELGKVFFMSMSDTVTTPGGGTNSRLHTFVPTDPTVTRQDAAITYVEKLGTGWFKQVPSMVSDGFSLRGDSTGMIVASLNLIGSGEVIDSPAITFPPTATPTVTNLTQLHKLFNTQVTLTPNDGGSYNTAYGCRYRSFQLDFKKTMLDAASYKPGCQRFRVTGDPTSGILRSSHEFDKQRLDFSVTVDLASGPELDCVLDQRPILLVLDITGGIIETTIRHECKITIDAAKYKTTKPVLVDGMWRLTISGSAFYSTANSRLFKIELTNDFLSYSTGW